jgi:hypothetical protein
MLQDGMVLLVKGVYRSTRGRALPPFPSLTARGICGVKPQVQSRIYARHGTFTTVQSRSVLSAAGRSTLGSLRIKMGLGQGASCSGSGFESFSNTITQVAEKATWIKRRNALLDLRRGAAWYLVEGASPRIVKHVALMPYVARATVPLSATAVMVTVQLPRVVWARRTWCRRWCPRPRWSEDPQHQGASRLGVHAKRLRGRHDSNLRHPGGDSPHSPQTVPHRSPHLSRA